jgi:DNA-binding MarR family transcriptional regulator
MRTAERIRFLVLAAQRAGNLRLSEQLRPLNLTTAQAEAIRVLDDNQPMTLGGLGGMLVCETGSNPSRLIDRLVATGLIRRASAPGDRRQVMLTLSPEGEAAAAAVRDIENEFYEDLDRASSGVDLGSVIRFLEAVTAGSAAASALDNRIAARTENTGEEK